MARFQRPMAIKEPVKYLKKIENMRKYATEKEVSGEEALKQGMREKLREFAAIMRCLAGFIAIRSVGEF